MIWDDPDLLSVRIFSEFSRDFEDLEAKNGETNEHRPILLATELYMYFSAMYRLRWYRMAFLR